VRWLLVHPGPAFSVQDVLTGWEEALRSLGETVAVYNLGDRLTFYDAAAIDAGHGDYRKALTVEQAKQLAANGLLSTCYQYWPEVVLVVSAFFIPAHMLDLLRLRGHRVVLLHTESPYEDDRQIELAAHADLNLVNDPTNLERFRLQAPTLYAPHAYREMVHQPGPTTAPVSDLAFVGTGYPSRVEFFHNLDLDGLRVALAGNWMRLDFDDPLRHFVVHDINECFDNEDFVPYYRSARCGINLYRREANDDTLLLGATMGPREVEMAACGLFFLRDPRQEGDDVLPMLPTFTSPAEASELLRWYLARDGLRARLARRARDAVADRTFTNHATQLLRLFDRQPVTA
jgi:hypothetical protein